MSANSPSEFEQLLAAHANRELSQGQRQRLEALAAELGRDADIADLDDLHAVFAGERELKRGVMAPAEPGEEADEVYSVLNRAAARAERAVRSLDELTVPEIQVHASRPRSVWPWSMAVAAGLLIAVGVWAVASGVFGPARPSDDLQLGSVPRILLQPELAAQAREISWHAVVGARTYDVAIRDAEDRTVLARPPEHSRSNRWQLSAADYELLLRHVGPLYLRVVARDSGGLRIATTGDLPLEIK